MDRNALDVGSEDRFAAFVESMSSILGHADRIAPFRSCCTGLILPGERKSVEPIAARIAPGRVQAAHQSLHHFVAKAEWSDEAMLRQVCAHVLTMIEKHGAIKAWIPEDAWREIAWREGTNENLASRFAAVRVRPAHRDYWRSTPHAEEWFLVEWPEGESEPTKYWLSTLPQDSTISTIVEHAKLRWRIERDYQELKQELGLDHYEGRGWRGFHHHMALCVAAYGFLVSERSLIPPSGVKTTILEAPRLSNSYRPRGSTHQTRTPRRLINREHPH